MVEWSIFNEIFAVAFNVLYFVIIIGTIFIVLLLFAYVRKGMASF